MDLPLGGSTLTPRDPTSAIVDEADEAGALLNGYSVTRPGVSEDGFPEKYKPVAPTVTARLARVSAVKGGGAFCFAGEGFW